MDFKQYGRRSGKNPQRGVAGYGTTAAKCRREGGRVPDRKKFTLQSVAGGPRGPGLGPTRRKSHVHGDMDLCDASPARKRAAALAAGSSCRAATPSCRAAAVVTDGQINAATSPGEARRGRRRRCTTGAHSSTCSTGTRCQQLQFSPRRFHRGSARSGWVL